MKVSELVGGDLIDIGGKTGLFIGRSDHPQYRGLQLVVWLLDDGSWSFDALSPEQYVGDLANGGHNGVGALDAALRPQNAKRPDVQPQPGTCEHAEHKGVGPYRMGSAGDGIWSPCRPGPSAAPGDEQPNARVGRMCVNCGHHSGQHAEHGCQDEAGCTCQDFSGAETPQGDES